MVEISYQHNQQLPSRVNLTPLETAEFHFQGIHPHNRSRPAGHEALIRFGSTPIKPYLTDLLCRHPHALTQKTCQLIKHDFPKLPPRSFLAVNFAPEQILSPQFSPALIDLAQTIDARRFVIEITEGESGQKYDSQQIYKVIEKISQKSNYLFAIDDYPKGISPQLLELMTKNRANFILKMDGSYLQDTLKLSEIPKLVSISNTSQIIFERISNPATQRQTSSLLNMHGLNKDNIYFQGYHFDKPHPLK